MESQGLVSIDIRILLATVVNFIIFFLLIKKFFYQKVKDIIASRQDAITSDIAEAESKKATANKIKLEYDEQMADILEKEREIIREANLEGQEQRREIIEQAREDARMTIEKAMAEIALEKNKAMNEVRSNIVELSLFATEKVIKQAVDKKQHEILIQDFIDSVGEAK
jgi:F-type H+-transporting ATPase subunit b